MTRCTRKGPARALVAVTTCVLAPGLFVACGGSATSRGSASPASSTSSTIAPAAPTTLPDVAPTAADFVNINTMTRVGDHFVGSLNGHLGASLAVARSPKGGVYPVGTVVQLIPTEAMVKRRTGYSPSTGDWEFFSLKVSATGTQIASSGAEVKNFFGGDCASCHRAASRFDFICGKTHGCAPIGISDAFIANVQQTDPRPKT